MSDINDRPTNVTVTRSSGSGLYFIVGALLVLVLVGGYVMLGMPGINTQVAKGPAPTQQKIDVTVQQPAAPAAPAAPARR